MHNHTKLPLKSEANSNTQMATVQSPGYLDNVNCASLVSNKQQGDVKKCNKLFDSNRTYPQQRVEYSNVKSNAPRVASSQVNHRHHSGKHHDSISVHNSNRHRRGPIDSRPSRNELKQHSQKSNSNTTDPVAITQSRFTFQEAKAAQQLEMAYKYCHSFIIRFPEPQLDPVIVSGFHSAIESVNFPAPPVSRHCAVKVKPGTDLDAFARVINKTPFGSGNLQIEIPDYLKSPAKLEEIDPCTLYVQPVLPGFTKESIHSMFTSALHIDIVFTPDDVHVLYAYIKFINSTQAMFEFKEAYRVNVCPKALLMRFRRMPYIEPTPSESIFSQYKALITQTSHTEVKPLQWPKCDEDNNRINASVVPNTEKQDNSGENKSQKCTAVQQDSEDNNMNVYIKGENNKIEVDATYKFEPPEEIDSDVDSLELDDVLIIN